MTEPEVPVRVQAEDVGNANEGGINRRLRFRVSDWPETKPGQFLMLTPKAGGAAACTDPLLPRPMAVYRVFETDSGAEIEVLYKVVGRGTTLLAETGKGDRIGVVGPLGRGFPIPRAGEHALLVGGGTGTASLYGVAAAAPVDSRVTVLLGARSSTDLMGRADFEALGVEVIVATEDGSEGIQGLVTQPLKDLLEHPGADPMLVYSCGPTPMMRACADLAAEHGRRCLVSLENPMACGFGVCLGCATALRAGGKALVCKDGPVFEAGQIDWENAGG